MGAITGQYWNQQRYPTRGSGRVLVCDARQNAPGRVIHADKLSANPKRFTHPGRRTDEKMIEKLLFMEPGSLNLEEKTLAPVLLSQQDHWTHPLS